MKTISGKLVSLQPISLSKASRYISDFASFENNGVSEVVSVYLNRASQAFGSLVQLHKDMKNPQSSHKKRKKKSFNDQENDERLKDDEIVVYHDGERKSKIVEVEDGFGSELSKGVENVVNGVGEGTTKKTKKQKKEEKSESTRDGLSGGNVEDEKMMNGVVDRTKKDGVNENIEEGLKMEVEHKKEKRKKRKEIEINDMEKEGKLEGKKKKRKSEDTENSVEQTRKHRKKSKVSNDG